MTEHYDVQLDLLLQVPEANNVFLEYLKASLCPEGLLFCMEVKEYKRTIDDTLKDKCEKIVDQFVRNGAKHEINVDGTARDAVIAKLESTEPVTINIFDEVFGIVYRELQHDAFPRFVRSMTFKAYKAKRGDAFMKSIALDLREEKIRDRILYQPDDFLSTTITDKDIKMILNLNQDSSDWKLISDEKEDFQVYKSKKQYSIGQKDKFMLCKTVGTLPVSYDKAIKSDINCSTRHLLDEMCTERINLDYVQAGVGNNNTYSTMVTRTGLNYSPLLLRRYYTLVMTTVHDSERQCYIHVGKSSKVYKKVKKAENEKKFCRNADMLYSFTYYKVNENKTRYIHVFFVAKQKNVPEKLYRGIVIKRGKSIHEGYSRTLVEMAKRNFTMEDSHPSLYNTLLDFQKRFGNKTWTIAE